MMRALEHSQGMSSTASDSDKNVASQFSAWLSTAPAPGPPTAAAKGGGGGAPSKPESRAAVAAASAMLSALLLMAMKAFIEMSLADMMVDLDLRIIPDRDFFRSLKVEVLARLLLPPPAAAFFPPLFLGLAGSCE